MKNFLSKLFGGGRTPVPATPAPVALGHKSPAPVIVVSGLPRSGTSMMMKMLEAGGLPVMIDGLRAPDPDNPEGYYELERVKELDKGDTAWINEARGQGIKVISALLEFLPKDNQYQVIFIHRRIEEVLRSQRKMLERRGEKTDDVGDAEMADLFAKHLTKVKGWLRQQPNFAVLDVDYNAMLQDPKPYIQSINQFLGGVLNEQAMGDIVNPDLYRNRAK
jgi:hypothetical protein